MKPKYIIPVLCACICALQPEDSHAQAVKLRKDSTERYFNALDYTLQKRYIPQGKKVGNDMPGKNFSLSAGAGIQKLRGAGAGLPLYYNGSISLSKDFTPFNTYRVTLLGGFNDEFKQGGIEIDHLFNLSDYIGGYRSGAHMNLYTVLGIGGYASKRDGKDAKISGSLHAGLQATYHLSKNWDWFVEPKMYLYTDGIDGYTCNKRYDLAYGVVTGITYRFTDLPVKPKSEDAGDNLFIEAGIGTQADFVKNVRENLPGLQMLGPAASLSLGKWFMPLGIRGTIFGGFHYTFNPEQNKSEEVYAGGRIEAMVNLNTLFKPTLTDPKLEVNLSAGYELGALGHRSAMYSKKIRMFHSPTAAAQLVYFVNEQIGVFGEARYSRSQYTQPYKSGITQDRHMQNLGVMFGVQYRRRKADFDSRRGVFKPYNFVYASVGGNFPMRTTNIKGQSFFSLVGQQATIGYGRKYTPISAVRAYMEVGRYPYIGGGTYPFSIGADYMLDVTNLIGNYNESRIFTLNAFAGIAYTHHELLKNNYFGFEAGLQESFRISDEWSIFLEECARGYKGKITPSARVYTSKKLSGVLSGSIGVSYRF